MNILLKKIYRFVTKIATEVWWPFWSNLRWRKAARKNVPLQEEDKVNSLLDIEKLVKKLDKKFIWTADGPDELWDSITPPPQTYIHYINGKLKDDCDGFHALVYHCLYNSNINCYLLTVNARTAYHCVLLFNHEGLWYVVDYTDVYDGFKSAIEAIENYNEIFVRKYGAKSDVFYNGLLRYNYNNGKFYCTKLSKEFYDATKK